VAEPVDAQVSKTCSRKGVSVRSRPPAPFSIRALDPDPALRGILVAEHFVAMDLPHPGDVLAALVDGLDALGKRPGCKAVRGIVHRPEVEGGHAMIGSILGKPVSEHGNGRAVVE
jgi:hypothetical protein